jgi:hypothetical protein
MEVPFQIELGAPSVRRIAAIIHVYHTELLPKIMNYDIHCSILTSSSFTQLFNEMEDIRCNPFHVIEVSV